MSNKIFTKLKIKPGHKVLILNSPSGYAKATKDVDLKPIAGITYDVVQVFVKDTAALDKVSATVLKNLQADTLLWMCYPKKTSSAKSDLSRDTGWDKLTGAGYEGVAIVSIDETWSALRFKEKEKIKAAKKSKRIAAEEGKPLIFTAILEKPKGGMDAAYVSVPFDIAEIFGTRGHVKVKALFDGHPYRGILSNMGAGSHIIIVHDDVRKAIGKKVGEKVRVQIQLDTEQRVVEMPAELLVALGDNAKARTFFDSLSFTNRKEYAGWIMSAKRDETRMNRLRETISKLLQGKKNPSEK
jgi:Domain of unknown function (DUF1905)/Bacteriocin-protection, YdeI or OmpD-Associated